MQGFNQAMYEFSESGDPDPGEPGTADSLVSRDDVLQDAERSLQDSLTSSQVQEKFRKDLVPLAFGVYKLQMLSEDPKIAKAAADSVMKIEGSLGAVANAGANSPTGGLVFNFNVQELGNALQQVSKGEVLEGKYE